VPAKWDITEPWRERSRWSCPKANGGDFFHDDELGALEKQALDANQTIKVSAARRTARGSAGIQIATQSQTWRRPECFQRQRLSGNRPTIATFRDRSDLATNILWPFTVEYEVDLFGRRRRSIEAAQASYQANAADLRTCGW